MSTSGSYYRRRKGKTAKDDALAIANSSTGNFDVAGFMSKLRALHDTDYEIDFDHDCSERIAFDLLPGVDQYCQMNDVVHPFGPVDDYVESDTVANVVATGICVGIGTKLANSAPAPEKVQSVDLQLLNTAAIQLPKSTMQAIDLIGTASDENVKVQVSHSFETSCVMLLKALHFASKDQKFRDSAGHTVAERAGLEQLSEVPLSAFNRLIVMDVTTEKRLHQIGDKLFERFRKKPKQISLSGKKVKICPARIASKDLSSYFQWLKTLFPDFKKDEKLLCSALLSVMPYEWLNRHNLTLRVLDVRFQDYDIGKITIRDVLDKINVSLSSVYVKDYQRMTILVRKAITYYMKWLPVLRDIFELVELGRSEKGHISQLVEVSSRYFERRRFRNIPKFPPVIGLKKDARTLECVRKLDTPSHVLTSGCYALSRRIHQRTEFQATSSSSLADIALRIVNGSLKQHKDKV